MIRGEILSGVIAGLYDVKVVKSGDVVEVIEYGKPILLKGSFVHNNSGSSLGRSVKASDKDNKRHREDTLNRARSNLRRLVNSNVYQYYDSRGSPYRPLFLTLTYSENKTDLKDANKDLRAFIRCFSYYLYGERGRLKYISVPEFQSRGAVHYHIIFFNSPFVPSDKVSEIWGNGFIKINKIRDVTNVGAYISKYLHKDSDDERLKGMKCYTTSEGLFRPQEIKISSGSEREKELRQLTDSLTLNYKKSFETEHLGNVIYKQYKI